MPILAEFSLLIYTGLLCAAWLIDTINYKRCQSPSGQVPVEKFCIFSKKYKNKYIK